MKFEMGRNRYPLPPHSEIISVAIKDAKVGHYLMLQTVSPGILLDLRDRTPGAKGGPEVCAIIDEQLHVYPAPDYNNEHEFRVLYAPPWQEA